MIRGRGTRFAAASTQAITIQCCDVLPRPVRARRTFRTYNIDMAGADRSVVIPARWAQAVCVIWPITTVFELFAGILAGSPRWFDTWPLSITFAFVAIGLLVGVIRL